MSDVKIFASERMSDAANAGGRITATEIPDGVTNNMFANIPNDDRVTGRVNMRKSYVKADTADTALYQRVSVFVDKEAADPAVSCVLFSTGSWTDERSDAVQYLQNYLAQGPKSRLYVYGKQAKGLRAVLLLQRPDLPVPDIGGVYFLTDYTNTQAFRVESLTQSVQTFTDTNGDYQLRVITLGITEPLQYTFLGGDPTRYSVDAPSVILTSIVADSANYYGISKLAADVASGAFDCTLDSIFAQLVPSNSGEISITGGTPSAAKYFVGAATAATSTYFGFGGSPGVAKYLGRAALPGSIVVTSQLPGTYTDDGIGNIKNGSVIVGSIDYSIGKIVPIGLSNLSEGAHAVTVAFIPAGYVSRDTLTSQQPITISNRRYNYTDTLNPVPAPGTMSVAYLVNNTWYTLTDDGSGTLSGSDPDGVGVVRFDTGALTTTTGALPDIGSAFIESWGIYCDYEIRTSDATIQPPAVTGQISHAANASSVIVTWPSGGVTKTATDDGAGNFTGDATGTMSYLTSTLVSGVHTVTGGKFVLRPNVLPDADAAFNFAYNDTSVTVTPTTITPTQSGGHLTFTIPGAPLKPGGANFWIQLQHAGDYQQVQLIDDGAGGFFAYGLATSSILPGATINYTTGAVSVPDTYTFALSAEQYSVLQTVIAGRVPDGTTLQYDAVLTSLQLPSSATSIAVNYTYLTGSTIPVAGIPAGGTTRSQSDSFTGPPLTLDLTPTVSSPIVPDATLFTFGGSTYFDRSGVLYRNLDVTTNAATVAGSLDVTTGIATITDWTPGASPALSIKALLTQPGILPVTVVNGRTPGTPVIPETYQIFATRVSDGARINATADANGNITSGDMHGIINTQTGVYNVAFGAYVLDSSLSTDDKSQPWYNPANVGTDGYIFRPAPVVPGSITYNCVLSTSLPQNPLILGLDPVTLPQDGRVPIYRPADEILFHDDQLDTMPGGLTAGQVYTISRNKLASAVLYDAHGTVVANASNVAYSVDLVAGTVTMATPLDLSAYTQPLVVKHRIEDLVQCLDAQIGGQIKFSPALTHSYTAANSRVSGLLQFGDAFASYTDPFYLQTWQNVFDDAPTGSPISAALDLLDYPIDVLNSDCQTIRVALVFTSSTTGNIVIEGLGVVGTFSTGANVAPLDLAGNPIFILDHRAFGSGWATGNAIRINFQGAGSSTWAVRTTLQAPATAANDSVTLAARWSKS